MSTRISGACLLVAGALLSALPARAVAPPDACPPRVTSRVYPVADLVVPIQGMPGTTGDTNKTEDERLIKLIQSNICPATWDVMGGAGRVDYFPLTMALVVSQTPDVHEQVQELLTALRRLQDVEVTVEMRFVTVSPETFDRLGIHKAEGGVTPGMATLDDTQMRLLLEAIEGDRRTTIMQAPKLTMFNGQKAGLDLSEKQTFVTGVDVVETDGKKSFKPKTQLVDTGLKVSVLPTVSPDRKSVTMQLGVRLGRMNSKKVPVFPVTYALNQADSEKAKEEPIVLTQFVQQPRFSTLAVEKTIKLEDGATALLTGWTYQQEVRNDVAPPILSKIPYLSRIFSTVSYGKETEHLLVLVTPRIIVRQEEEQKPADPPPVTNQPSGPSCGAQEACEAEAKPAPVVAPRSSTLHVRDRRFELSYELDNVGPSKVRGLEVWWTRDAGKWERHSDEVQPTGRLPVIVQGEGRWGFTLIAHSGAGLSTPPPRSGDLPQVWVEVDQTPPVVKLDPVEVRGKGEQGEVVLRWSASDRNLSETPVTLRYARKPEGPWLLLHPALPAVGNYTVAMTDLPHQCWFRVEAVDLAGNTATAQSPAPVKIDLKIPVVRDVKVNGAP